MQQGPQGPRTPLPFSRGGGGGRGGALLPLLLQYLDFHRRPQRFTRGYMCMCVCIYIELVGVAVPPAEHKVRAGYFLFIGMSNLCVLLST